MSKNDAGRIGRRVELLLSDFTPEERVRGRDAKWVAEFLGLSLPTVYRLWKQRRIRGAKIEGRERPGRGRGGPVRFTAIDAATFRVLNEEGGAESALAQGAA